MALDITIDAIIRRNLAKRRLPLHYYGPMLVIAKDGLEELHFDALQKVKIAVIDLNTTLMTGDLPADFVEELFVGTEVGDKVRPIGYNHRLNKKSSATAFEEKDDLYVLYNGVVSNLVNIQDALSDNGRNFGRPVTFTDGYTIMRDLGKIRVENKSDLTKVHLIYLTMPEKVSNKSVIHPFAKKTLESFINWEWSKYTKDRDQLLREKEYYNERRIFGARKNKMTTTEIKRIFRNKNFLAVKN